MLDDQEAGWRDALANYKARIDDVISKPYALSDVLLRANTILARNARKHRETMMV
jgi:DNA-binding response OmpR family regulator